MRRVSTHHESAVDSFQRRSMQVLGNENLFRTRTTFFKFVSAEIWRLRNFFDRLQGTGIVGVGYQDIWVGIVRYCTYD